MSAQPKQQDALIPDYIATVTMTSATYSQYASKRTPTGVRKMPNDAKRGVAALLVFFVQHPTHAT